MNRKLFSQLQNKLDQLKAAEEELAELNQQLRTFEALVDAHLGKFLDQLSELNAETAELNTQLQHIREKHLFGKDVMSYMDGAPLPNRAPKLSDLPPLGISQRASIHARIDDPSAREQIVPDIKVLYRKLARRYHPDLARNEADRSVSNEQMTEINQAYNAGDMKTLMRLAGISLPYGVKPPQPDLESHAHRGEPLNEQEEIERKLKQVHQQITRMSSLPIVKLSLEVKLAQHQGRNLLREMAAELHYKVRRKLAERDYLQSQINASIGQPGE